jgi:hypothetical protein
MESNWSELDQQQVEKEGVSEEVSTSVWSKTSIGKVESTTDFGVTADTESSVRAQATTELEKEIWKAIDGDTKH